MHFPKLPDWLVYAVAVSALVIVAVGRQERSDAPPPPPPVPGEEGLPLGPSSPFDPSIVVQVPERPEPGSGTAFSVGDDGTWLTARHVVDGCKQAAIVVADGLSALAVHKHTAPFLARLEEQTHAEGWSLSPVILVEQGRVAVADEIGQLLGAKMVVILIGERPGLSSPDSLGLYFTYNPKVGLTDAYRNCISNVRLEGLSYGMAAHRLLYLMREACRRQLSGVNLKDEAQVQTLESDDPDLMKGNFLLSPADDR